ncbi:MAG: DUF799 domain-containing protein [Aestuariibacter sp.]|uniref:DUF799 domain-containing protein n=1 Tax=Marisediminitalea aggregata TaxID=634436 RepID=UPI0020CDBAB7|nr:DUF799 domain-containing protein [Marisediminitalea aggregata]MCP3866326.1 DUF799 domain-containing protein [Aestuariibacter sp.]MCP4276692.1 DUF799 domain-containing protein [Gammaproteobacteria bacterium]MCP4528372.1 DUF799 domain-containing protein [Aestuariibacter sp.]MCP4945996.1 DUF799 domain-containing protein [Aestuariibacter sp.]MCP9477204.1 DUF799 domain-containing protein [Marisediminitalea aggregata]
MLRLYIFAISAALLSGCVSLPPSHDYSAFRNADPHSIIVLPPVNNTPEVIAPYSMLSQIVVPIAESGYYVYPTAVVDQTFKSNGLTVAEDIHALPVSKIREIFGADAALYVTIEEYGTSYVVLSSDTIVTASASLVDLKTGTVLWQDAATASSAETRGNSGGGLVGMLVEAALNQIIETVTDRGFDIAALTSNRLLSSEAHNGLLYGPRSPKYGQPAPSEKAK